MSRRRFNSGEKATLYLAANGKCTACDDELEEGWHGDHVVPVSRGGRTDVLNGQALCPGCNLKKGDDLPDKIKLRPHQAKAEDAALDIWQISRDDPELGKLVALIHPGAGKTLLALNIANTFYRKGYIACVIYLCPRLNLCVQVEMDWKSVRELYAQPRMGDVSHRENNPPFIRGKQAGYSTTYASSIQKPILHMEAARQKPTLLVVDEAQQLGVGRDGGESGTVSADVVEQLMSVCAFSIIMTGTPYRSDGKKILGANYTDPDENGVEYIEAPVSSTYMDGLSNPPEHGGPYLRFFEFYLHDGRGREELLAARETVDFLLSQGDPGSLSKVLTQYGYWSGLIDKTIRDIREYQEIDPRYCGLIAAANQRQAKAIQEDVQRRYPKIRSLVAVSEDNQHARNNLRDFRSGGYDLLVTVNMAYVGFDHKPISVVTILTPYRWEGYLRQLVARGLRVMDGVPADQQTLRVNAPDDPAMSDFCDMMRSEAEAGVKERRPGGCGGDGPSPELSIMVGAELLDPRVKGVDPYGDLEPPEAMWVEGQVKAHNVGPAVNLSGVAAMFRSNGVPLGADGITTQATAESSTVLDTKTDAEKEKDARYPLLREMRQMDNRLMAAGYPGAEFGFCNGRTNYEFRKALASCGLDEIVEYQRFFREVLKPRLERYCEERGA